MAVAEVRRSFRRWRVGRAVHEARRKGHGLYITEFQSPADSVDGLPTSIVLWCRETIAACRRPLGIDHFDLTLTVDEQGQRHPQTHRLAFLRPAQLYDESAVMAAVTAFLGSVALGGESGTVKVAAALLSWGDIAHASMV